MSAQVPTYEETLTKVANLEKLLLEQKTLSASTKAAKDDDTKKLDASFKQAMEEMEKKDKEHSAMNDDHDKVKDAFKQAMDMKDPEKKKEAMKKAMDMKDEHEKKAMDEPSPKENVDKQPQREAAIAQIVMKKLPLMQKILEATKIMDASNYSKVEKQLEAASLDEVEQHYATIQPYIAAIGLGAKSEASQGQTGMIPFQASSVITDKPDDIFSASSDNIDFSKVKTSDILGMYN